MENSGWCDWSLIFALADQFNASAGSTCKTRNSMMMIGLRDYLNWGWKMLKELNKIFFSLFSFVYALKEVFITCLLNTYFFSRFPAPVSRNPFAKGLLSIFNCVICKKKHVKFSCVTLRYCANCLEIKITSEVFPRAQQIIGDRNGLCF